eukprot:gene5833-7259_t
MNSICKSFINLSINATKTTSRLASTATTNSNFGIRTIIYTNPNEISLNNLRDNPGATIKRVRLGRGIGSGRGKTSTRGHGGQKSRAGHNIPRGFEGGQTPLYKRMRKYGFSNVKFEKVYTPINFYSLSQLIKDGKLNPNETITMKHIFDTGFIGAIKHGVKLLSDGKDVFDYKINIELTDFSKSAREKIEELGGVASNQYYDRVGLRYLLHPEKFDFVPKRAKVPLKLKEKYPDHPTGYMGAYSTHGGVLHIEDMEETSTEEQQQTESN